MAEQQHDMQAIRVWDRPTRLFHWLFAVATVTAFITGDSPRHTDLHTFCGYLVLALITFRLVWGFIGGRHARFSAFVRKPLTAIAYLRALAAHQAPHTTGHNPAGGWAVLAMLGMNLLIGITGILVLGAEEGFGPLAGWSDVGTGVALHELHELLAWSLMAVVVLHIAAVIYESRSEGQNLAAGMLHGRKRGLLEEAEPNNASGAALVMVIALGLYAVVWSMPYLGADEEEPHRPFSGPALNMSEAWRTNCADCHLPYHPSLLPARSWNRLLREQSAHFEEDLYLDGEVVLELLEFAVANAAERGVSEAAWRIDHSIAPDQVPLRISDTDYWREAHAEVDEAYFEREPVNGRFDCAACHLDADSGRFDNGAMHLPGL